MVTEDQANVEGGKATATPKYNIIYLTIKQAREKRKAEAEKAVADEAAAELARANKRKKDEDNRRHNMSQREGEESRVHEEVLKLQASTAVREPMRIRGGSSDTPVEIEAEDEDDECHSDDELECDEYPGDDAENARKSGTWRYKPPPNSPLGKATDAMKEKLTDDTNRFKTDYQDARKGKAWWSMYLCDPICEKTIDRDNYCKAVNKSIFLASHGNAQWPNWRQEA